jgi:predicted N-acyltransferase
MAYSYSIFGSIDKTPLDEWNTLCQDPGEIFMDPRFITSVECSMGDEAKYWTLIIYDDHQYPVAIACLFLWSVDAAILTDSKAIGFVKLVRKWWDKFLYFKCLCLGLPVSAGQSHLRIRSDADLNQVCRLINMALKKLSRKNGVKIVVLKEFSPQESERLQCLKKYGYRLEHSRPMNMFNPRFIDLNDYLSALRSRYRIHIQRSLRITENAGYKTVEMPGGKVSDRIYTDKVHSLYEAVLDHVNFKFEEIPASFFREIAKRFGDQAVFTFVYHMDTIVAFLFSLRTDCVYHMMFIGINYEVSRENHLYFSTMYKHLDYALRQQVSDIYMGSGSDDFKMRLGCFQVPRHIYIRGIGAFRILLKLFSRMFFSRVKLKTSKNIWRKDT